MNKNWLDNIPNAQLQYFSLRSIGLIMTVSRGSPKTGSLLWQTGLGLRRSIWARGRVRFRSVCLQSNSIRVVSPQASLPKLQDLIHVPLAPGTGAFSAWDSKAGSFGWSAFTQQLVSHPGAQCQGNHYDSTSIQIGLSGRLPLDLWWFCFLQRLYFKLTKRCSPPEFRHFEGFDSNLYASLSGVPNLIVPGIVQSNGHKNTWRCLTTSLVGQCEDQSHITNTTQQFPVSPSSWAER